MKKWDIFISHASEDKTTVAIPLKELLEKQGLRVWLDQAEVELGDSLIKKIADGLRRSRYGAVILSEIFFSKPWGRDELTALTSGELQGKHVFLTIWHGIEIETIRKYSAILAKRLADDLAARTEDGLPKVAHLLGEKVKKARRAATRRRNCVLGLASLVLMSALLTAILWPEPPIPPPDPPRGHPTVASQPSPTLDSSASRRLISGDQPYSFESLPYVKALPAKAVAYVYRQAWPHTRDKLTGSSAIAVINNTSVQAFFERIRGRANRSDRLGLLTSWLLLALDSESTVATVPNPASEPSHLRFLTFGILDILSERRSRLQMIRSSWSNASTQPATEPRSIQTTVLGAPAMLSFASPRTSENDPHEALPIPAAAFTQDKMVWANSSEAIEELKNSVGANTLATSARFVNTVRQVLSSNLGPPIALFYHYMGQDQEFDERRTRFHPWASLSWACVESVAGATFVHEGGYRNRYYLKLLPQRTGLFLSSRQRRVRKDWIARVPADATGLMTGVWDAYSLLWTCALIYQWPVSPGLPSVESAEDDWFSVVQPFCGFFGDRYLAYFLPDPVMVLCGQVPSVIVVAELADPIGLVSVLENLQLRKLSANSDSYRLYSLGKLTAVFPLFLAVSGHEAFVGFDQRRVEEAVHRQVTAASSLLSVGDFEREWQVSLENYSFFLFFQPGGFSRAIVDPLLTMARAFGGFRESIDGNEPGATGESFDMSSIPQVSDLSAGVTQPTVMTAVDLGDGMLFDGWAPVKCTPYYWANMYSVSQLRSADQPFELNPVAHLVASFVGLD